MDDFGNQFLLGSMMESVTPNGSIVQADDGSFDSDELSKGIRRRGNKWEVTDAAGKVLGTHNSKVKARRQLAAIEASNSERSKTARATDKGTWAPSGSGGSKKKRRVSR